MEPTLLAAGGALSVLFLVGGAAWPRRRSPIRDRLHRYGQHRPLSLQEMEWEQPFSERVLRPLLASLARGAGRLTPHHHLQRLRHRLDLAGNPYGWSPAEFVGLRLLGAILGGLVVLPPMLLLAERPAGAFVFGIAGVLLGQQLPPTWLAGRIRRRQKEILLNLPDTLDLLTISVEAGLGFDGAMSRVAAKMDNAIGQAFDRALTEIRLGRHRATALREMSARMEVGDMHHFVSAVVQADQLGVPIAKVLRVQSEQMRIKRRQRAQEQAQKAPIKMIFPMVLLIFPAIWVIVLGPAVPKLVEAFSGF